VVSFGSPLVLAWLVFMYYRFVDDWLTSLSPTGKGLAAMTVVVAMALCGGLRSRWGRSGQRPDAEVVMREDPDGNLLPVKVDNDDVAPEVGRRPVVREVPVVILERVDSEEASSSFSLLSLSSRAASGKALRRGKSPALSCRSSRSSSSSGSRRSSSSDFSGSNGSSVASSDFATLELTCECADSTDDNDDNEDDYAAASGS
jgi:uncharacterized membrane protein YgcG